MIMKNKPKQEPENWKTHPYFSFIEVSTWGDVRTLDRVVPRGKYIQSVKGRVLKQYHMKSGYLQTTFRVNGKRIHKYVHRLIAETFLPNPNNWPEINHKDCDRTNNDISNLEWCTGEYNIEYREKYGKALKRPLYAVNLRTLEVSRFPSRMEAARRIGVYYQSIDRVIKDELHQTGGYYFTEDKSKINKNKLRKIKVNTPFLDGVFAIKLETLEVLQFSSQSEASQGLGVHFGNINKVVRGRQKTAKGLWFTYADDHAVENVRKKFGNTVAAKVKALMVQTVTK